jgi:hypothetical protein
VNGLSAFLQQAFDILRTQAAALWNVVSAIIANKPEPARNVVVYTAALVVLAVFALPRIIKAVTK